MFKLLVAIVARSLCDKATDYHGTAEGSTGVAGVGSQGRVVVRARDNRA